MNRRNGEDTLMDDRRFFSKIGMSYFVMALLTTGIQIVVSLILAVAAPEWTDPVSIYSDTTASPVKNVTS